MKGYERQKNLEPPYSLHPPPPSSPQTLNKNLQFHEDKAIAYHTNINSLHKIAAKVGSIACAIKTIKFEHFSLYKGENKWTL